MTTIVVTTGIDDGAKLIFRSGFIYHNNPKSRLEPYIIMHDRSIYIGLHVYILHRTEGATLLGPVPGLERAVCSPCPFVGTGSDFVRNKFLRTTCGATGEEPDVNRSVSSGGVGIVFVPLAFVDNLVAGGELDAAFCVFCSGVKLGLSLGG